MLQAELRIDWAESLKDKRRVVRSLRERLHREHLVSFAEVAAHDVINTAVLGVAVVAEHGSRAGDVLDACERKLRAEHDAEVLAVRRELIAGEPLDAPEAPGVDREAIAAEMLARAVASGQLGGEGGDA